MGSRWTWLRMETSKLACSLHDKEESQHGSDEHDMIHVMESNPSFPPPGILYLYYEICFPPGRVSACLCVSDIVTT